MKLFLGFCAVILLPQVFGHLSNNAESKSKVTHGSRIIFPVPLTTTDPTHTTEESASDVETPTSTMSPAAMEEERKRVERKIAAALGKFVSTQQLAVRDLESEIERENWKGLVRNFMDDFEYNAKGFWSEGKWADYVVMLQPGSTEFKYENLLFLNRENASNYCADNFENGTLLTVHSAEESAFLVDWLYRQMRLPAKVWLGARRNLEVSSASPDASHSRNHSTFYWEDNGQDLTFTNWHNCEPNGEHWSENCVEMLSNYYPYPDTCAIKTKPAVGAWNDLNCDSNIKNLVVCKKIRETEAEATATAASEHVKASKAKE